MLFSRILPSCGLFFSDSSLTIFLEAALLVLFVVSGISMLGLVKPTDLFGMNALLFVLLFEFTKSLAVFLLLWKAPECVADMFASYSLDCSILKTGNPCPCPKLIRLLTPSCLLFSKISLMPYLSTSAIGWREFLLLIGLFDFGEDISVYYSG